MGTVIHQENGNRASLEEGCIQFCLDPVFAAFSGDGYPHRHQVCSGHDRVMMVMRVPIVDPSMDRIRSRSLYTLDIKPASWHLHWSTGFEVMIR